jgi:site-specific DNA-methyltransferase (adenine-specific)
MGGEQRAIRLSWDGRAEPRARSAAAVKRSTSDTFGTLYVGDNLTVLDQLIEEGKTAASLIYLDPPFFTQRDHATTRAAQRTEVAFSDQWDDLAHYLEALGARLSRLRDLLLPHGSLVIHVDTKTSHYVKVLADGLFGLDAFASEIVWRYRRWPSKTPNFQRVHDVLLRYRKDPSAAPRWNQTYEPLAASTMKTWGTRKQQAIVEGGRRMRSSSTEVESLGVPLGDVWDIGIVAPVARERTGFPSQKPEKLLERLVNSLTYTGDLVLDPYAGSGTTLAVAHRLGRRFVGIDESPVAVSTIEGRLAAQGAPLLP